MCPISVSVPSVSSSVCTGTPVHIPGLHMCACVPESGQPTMPTSMPQKVRSPLVLSKKGNRVCNHRTRKLEEPPKQQQTTQNIHLPSSHKRNHSFIR